jgi:uncharacterized protein YneF (UPF0154 family)
MSEVKKLAENPELGAYRVSAVLEQMGIKLSVVSQFHRHFLQNVVSWPI